MRLHVLPIFSCLLKKDLELFLGMADKGFVMKHPVNPVRRHFTHLDKDYGNNDIMNLLLSKSKM